MFKFNLGDTVRCAITGFTGVVYGRTEWLNGCLRYAVQSKKLDNGKPLDLVTFDEQDLVLVKAKVSKKSKATGGPRQAAKRLPDAIRPF